MQSSEMNNKICMVTGANSGIGKAAAGQFARLGATTVLVCRNEKKGKAAQEEIKTQTGNQSIELFLADLSSLESVRMLASDYKQKHDKLHVLVNNAAVVEGSRVVTKDGLEEVFVVNYLSQFLLTNLLLDTLKASAPARIVNVTSSVHAEINFEDLQMERGYNAIKSYGQSKLAQILFTGELAERLAGSGVTVNCVHPGAVRTHLGDEGGIVGIGIRIARPFYMSPEKGAETLVYVSTSPEVEGATGKYFYKKKERPAPFNKDDANHLWDVSMKLSGLSS
jgi:NAD(P)-dependent dehydrogenase (short-subunit alcohol dehydrogenase family)